MGLTNSYTDRSTDQGFQFEFRCERCQSAYLTQLQTSKVGVAEGFLTSVAGLFGGAGKEAAEVGDGVKNTLRSKSKNDALTKALAEAEQHFKHCSLCGKWVCQSVCWNAGKQMCVACAPDLIGQTASAQATAAKDQIWDKAKKADLVAAIDVTQAQMAVCPHCGAKSQGSKFCSECGQAVSSKELCAKCGHEMNADSKFCPDCGAKRGA